MGKTIRGDKKARKKFRRDKELRKLVREHRCSDEELALVFDEIGQDNLNSYNFETE